MHSQRHTNNGAWLIALVSTLLSGCNVIADLREERPGVRLESLRAPSGHVVSVFARDVPQARHMVLTPRGTLFVGSFTGHVHAFVLDDTRIVSRHIVASGLRHPSGVAFANGTLYVADRTQIVRLEGIEDRLNSPPVPLTTLEGLPNESRHDAHAMAIGPDGKLYVSVGSPCDTCEPKNDEYGLIIRTELDGTRREIVARGIRNSVGFDWHPNSKELWFTENGQDSLGTDRPNDELNRVQRMGEHFGFPYCHDRAISDPTFGSKRACSEFTPPELGLGARVAALGMRFMRSAGAAPIDSPTILIARHGSHPPARVGYDVVQVRFEGNRATRLEPFLTGFLQGREYWGRPVDVLQLRDGSVLVSDDLNGVIYRVAAAAR
jgi:glucose/arabinose dehydrogenase